MKKVLLLISLSAFAHYAHGQFNDTISYYAYLGSTGTYNKTNYASSFVLNNMAKFSVAKKSYSLNTVNSYIWGKQSGIQINNDISSVVDFDFLKNKHRLYVWAIGAFDKSYSLKINHRMQTGAGLGFTVVRNPTAVVVITDGIIYERADLTTSDLGRLNYDVWRNSLRIKYRWVHSIFVLDGAGFLQPSISTSNDNIIKSTTTFSVKIKKWLSLSSVLNYNKITRTHRENLIFTYGVVMEKFF